MNLSLGLWSTGLQHIEATSGFVLVVVRVRYGRSLRWMCGRLMARSRVTMPYPAYTG